jgi:predicted extracellular nuclease
VKHLISYWSLALFVAIAVPMSGAEAADRVHTGQWETTMETGGRSLVSKTCVTPEEAQLMNGDENTLKAAIEKATAAATAATGCKLTAVKASGNQVTVSSQCPMGANTGTTTYHGDSYDSENTNGTKVHAKRIGACP